jgi:MoaA/NifB/PqqE/SkfB family radical SAM enzyme
MNLLNYRNYGRLWRVYGRSLLRYGTPKKILNALRTEWAYRRRTVDVRSAPYLLFLEPLYYCNLDCPLCDRQVFPDARKGSAAGKFSLALYDRILDEVGDYLFQSQIFGQGEPLLDWPLTKALIQKTHARKIFTLVSTNCTLAKPAIAEEVVTSGLDHLVCAVDGITQTSYAQYRAGGHIDDALAGMRNFVDARRRTKSRIEIEWQFLVHKGNAHEVETARKMARDLGVFFRDSPLRGMEFDPALRKAWLLDKDYRDVPADLHDVTDPWPCYFLWRSLVLNSNHKVARCLVYQNVAEYADLNQMSVLEAYNHPTTRRARQLFSKKPVADGPFPAPCANCAFYERTHGGPKMDKHDALRRPKPPAEQFVPSSSLRIKVRRTGLAPAAPENSSACP